MASRKVYDIIFTFSMRKDIVQFMDIKKAKEYIKDTVKLYLKKDEFGEYRIPVVRQRPIFLLGAPGVGKTAIMEQVASELGIALVSYSMTHHTRQSALGLPYIVKKEYNGEQFDISEYTMSEIIASIYEVMDASGVSEGILFLDEINCVSETLAPAMLQFLQYKIFGKHKVPEGWVIVTAGNPPEYNKSVREFDVVTYDRLKVMEVEADYSVWKEYAHDRRLSGAIINYLDINKDDFYVIDTTVRGRGYVTARGWEDLSQIILLYEEEHLEVDETLVGQYLKNDRIVREFTAYYDLYRRYVSDYCVDDILKGTIDAAAVDKAGRASYDEKLSLVGIFSDRILGKTKDITEKSDFIQELFKLLTAIKNGDKEIPVMLQLMIEARHKNIDSKTKAGAYNDMEKRKDKNIVSFLTNANKQVNGITDRDDAFDIIKQSFGDKKQDLMDDVQNTTKSLDSVLEFMQVAFGEGNELVLFLTELTVDKSTSIFLANFGNKKYSELSKKLMLDDPSDKIMQMIDRLDL